MTKIYKCGSLASDNKDVNGIQLETTGLYFQV